MDAGCVSTEVEHSMHTKAVMESWFNDLVDALQVSPSQEACTL